MTGGQKSTAVPFLRRAFWAVVRPRLSVRVFIYFFAIALIPVVVVSTLVISSATDQLLKDTGKRQQTVAIDLANRVDTFIESNLDQLTLLARLYSQGSWSFTGSNKQLTELLNQNPNLRKIRFILRDGNERSYSFQDGKVVSEKSPSAAANAPAVRILADKSRAYILSVGRGPDGVTPQLVVGIPILQTYTSTGRDASNRFQPASESNLLGALQGYFDISTLWQGFNDDAPDKRSNRTAYVVDNFGNLAAHSNNSVLQSNTGKLDNIEAVTQIKNKNTDSRETFSETGTLVLSSPMRLKYGEGWGIVVQEPISSIYAGVDGYIQSAAVVSFSAIVLSILAALYFGRQISRPLQTLALGAKRMEAGDFSTPISLTTKDEFEELAGSFNNMSKGITTLIQNLQSNNMQLVIEKAKLNNIISSVSDGIVAVNRAGVIVSINPQAAMLLGHLPSELKDKKFDDEFRWEREGSAFYFEISKPGVHKYDDLTLRSKDSVHFLDLMVAVLESTNTPKDDDVAAIITIRDQTASRELDFMKLDFVAIAAHELRTPLTVVRGYLDMLNTSAEEKSSIYDLANLQKAIVGANQLRDLINKLLNIARIERGDMEIFIEKLDLKLLVSENVEQHLAVAKQKQQTIEFQCDPQEPVYVPADPASLVEVMNNLLGNALKYTGQGGKIVVKMTADNQNTNVSVTDNGPGIPTELRSKLFTKFYRAERSMIAGSRGTGLGLFISKTIIELQQGTIGLTSEEGHGSTFYFTLPIYNAERDDKRVTKKTTGGIRGWFKKNTHR